MEGRSEASLRPGEAGRIPAAGPELFDPEAVAYGGGDLQGDGPRGADDLGGEVDGLAPEAGGVGGGGDDRVGHVPIEGLEEGERGEDRVVEGGVRLEALEGQLFGTEVLEGPVEKFVAAPAVVESDDPLRRRPLGATGFPPEGIDGAVLAQVRVEDRVRAGEGEEPLGVFVGGTRGSVRFPV